MLVLLCDRCERKIIGSGAGFAYVDLREASAAAQGRLHGSAKAPWRVSHVDCAPEAVKPLNPYFRIWVERIDTVDALLDAMADLSRYPWFAASDWGSGLVRRVMADTETAATVSEVDLERRATRQRLIQQRGPLADDDPRHGLIGYVQHGCKCDRCRGAVAAKRQEARAAQTPAQRERINAARRARDNASKRPHGDQHGFAGTVTATKAVDSLAGHTATGARA
ncbi:hypothetical protein A5657_02575 [Mycobacterium kubicae]|nr:hypothetical protein A5657_02575 [Mycobacterium kubicae]